MVIHKIFPIFECVTLDIVLAISEAGCITIAFTGQPITPSFAAISVSRKQILSEENLFLMIKFCKFV